nr:amidohydrolase [Novosphingobium flavum]
MQSGFAVEGDHIVAVGSDAKVLALAGPSTRRIDLGGAAVIPGLNDSHDHLWNTGRYLVRGIDMVGVASRQELVARLRAAVEKAAPGTVVYTTIGWSVKPGLTRADLDAISATVPIALIANRRGAGMLNTAALARLGISQQQPSWRGEAVPVDKSGEPTGETPGFPASVQMIKVLLPPMTSAEEDKLVKDAMTERNALGITSIRELALWPSGLAALERMRRENQLTVRFSIGMEYPDQENSIPQLAALKRPPMTDAWLQVETSSEEPWAGTMSAAQFTAFVRELNRIGWRAATHVAPSTGHALGADTATDITLAAFEAADRDASLKGKRWSVEHVPFATPLQMKRMEKLGLIVSVQDAGIAPAASIPASLGRMGRQSPIRELLDRNLVVVGGSDYGGPGPASRTPNNPMLSFYFYVTRLNREGKKIAPAQRISRLEALRLFTSNSAFATFQENVKGRIVPGLFADFVILNQDLMTVPEKRILETRPLATFVGGKNVYSAPRSRF